MSELGEISVAKVRQVISAAMNILFVDQLADMTGLTVTECREIKRLLLETGDWTIHLTR